MTTGELQTPAVTFPAGAFMLIQNHVFPIASDLITIGRQLDNDLVIGDSLVSRRHAQIEWQKGRFVLTDLGSTSGTLLNNKPVKNPVSLYSGDMILIANTPIMFVIDPQTHPLASNQTTEGF
ncbi:MAG: FHA domain-containing protein [Chloroflexi bacterium]|nr:FHA domain-containing protein [Chloroflexota bacterium]